MFFCPSIIAFKLWRLIFLARNKETIDKFWAIDGLEGTGLCSLQSTPFEMITKTTDKEIRCLDIEVSRDGGVYRSGFAYRLSQTKDFKKMNI